MAYAENDVLERLDEVIDSHLTDKNFSIEDVCLAIGISRSQLFRLLKEKKGLSVSRYVRQRKMVKAKELLESSDLKISEITYEIGLDSPQTFTKYFTESFKISPTEYRKNLQLKVPNETQPVEAKEGIVAPVEAHSINIESIPNAFKKYNKKWLVGSGVLILLVGVLVFLGIYFTSTEKRDDGEVSIAIMPFQLDTKEQSEWLMDGLMEQLYYSFTRFEEIRLISRNSTRQLAGSQKSTSQIGQELNVNYVLSGSIKYVSSTYSISLELIKASNDQVVWAKNVKGNAEEVNRFVNGVAIDLVRSLNRKLKTQQISQLSMIATENEEAYREYLQGKKLLEGRTKEKLEASIERFNKAIELEPDFSDAYANKAIAYFLLGSSEYMNKREGIKLAEKNALTAIRLDASNANAYACLANGYRELNKWEQAITTYQIALQYSPNDAQINYWYSIALRSLGYLDEAVTYSTKALAADPLHATIVAGHIGNLSYAHQYKECELVIKNYELSLRDFFIYHYVIGYYYLNKGDYKKAVISFKKSRDLNPEDISLLACLCFSEAKLGNVASTKKMLQTLKATSDNYATMATLYAGLGDKQNCLNYLRLGQKEGLLPNYLKTSPIFMFLHGDPGFEEMLDQLGLKHVTVLKNL